jgi:hypothetical protein
MSDAPELKETPPEWLAEARALHGLPVGEPVRPSLADSSDPATIRTAQRAARLDAKRQSATIAGMMENADVRAWMYRLLQSCRAFAAHDFPGGVPLDALQLARQAAHREVAQMLTAGIMAACPDLFVLMLRENADV